MSKLADTEVLLRVSEHKGNPGSFNFFLKDTCILSIRFSVALEKDVFGGEAPVIEGDTPLAAAFVKAAGFKKNGSSSRVIRIGEDIKFIDNGEPFIILKLVDFRGEGIVRLI
jgi:rRNA maturation protein Rpf1